VSPCKWIHIATTGCQFFAQRNGLHYIIIIWIVPILVIRFRRRGDPGAANLALASHPPGPGKVHFLFHKYSGFLIVFRQSRYDAVLPIDDVEVLMKQLIRHNLTWGLLSYGGVFVPVLTYFEWRSQKKRNAAARSGFPVQINQQQ